VKLLIKRDQQMKGMLGTKATFQITAKAEISPEEQKAIVKYGLGDTVLYKKYEVSGGAGLLGMASRAVLNATNVVVTINSLVSGSRVECKDVVDMLAVEEQIVEGAKMFKQVLHAAMHFGGNEEIEI
jgi:hypothetical protein